MEAYRWEGGMKSHTDGVVVDDPLGFGLCGGHGGRRYLRAE